MPSTPREPLQPRVITPIISNKQIRRKSSGIFHVDSSEDSPSSHDSIYEALYFSASNSDDSCKKIVNLCQPEVEATNDGRVANENSRKLTATRDSSTVLDSEFLYGNGTPLDTITEQKSYATIRSIARTKSADDISAKLFLGHRDSFILSKTPRRKLSLSLNDLALINKSYHEACAVIESETRKTFPNYEVYAQPKVPVNAPPERPPTPPGMPSWTAAQHLPTQRPRMAHHQWGQSSGIGALNAIREFFGFPTSDMVRLSNDAPQSGTPTQSRPSSGPGRERVAPRFRPPRSSYGPIDQHPLVTATSTPPMKAGELRSIAAPSSLNTAIRPPRRARKLQRVRFTPSATARDSEQIMLQNAMESTTIAAIHPLTPESSTISVSQAISKQEKCPHRKKEPTKLKATPPHLSLDHHSSVPPSNEYHSHPISSSPIGGRNITLAAGEFAMVDSQPSRSVSISSTVALMSPATIQDLSQSFNETDHYVASIPRKEKPVRCWKCRAEFLTAKLDKVWMDCASCLCFVCCGYLIDDDMSTHQMSQPEMRMPLGPRRVILQQTPASMI